MWIADIKVYIKEADMILQDSTEVAISPDTRIVHSTTRSPLLMAHLRYLKFAKLRSEDATGEQNVGQSGRTQVGGPYVGGLHLIG